MSEQKASLYLKELAGYKVISDRESTILGSLFADKAFLGIPIQDRAKMRARMMKNLLACLMVQDKGEGK